MYNQVCVFSILRESINEAPDSKEEAVLH